VGVARDARYTSPRDETPATVYQPYRQVLDSITQMHFEVRTAGPPSAMAPAVRRVVHDLDKTLPVYDLKTQDEQVDQTLFQERLFAKLSILFSLLAMLRASVGLYAVLSYAVVQRTGEIGIRMALGAQRSTILSMVLKETFMLAFVGTLIGVVAALAAAKLASSQISDLLYGLEVADHVTIVLATLLIIAIVVFAGFLPARKASRVDPMIALRYE
jgi:ABC-type antimicrobial peptide transport system permease subunit